MSTLTDNYTPQTEAVEHLIQFDDGGDSFLYWPECERDRDSGLEHLRAAHAKHYSVRSRTYVVGSDGKLHLEWRTIASKGRYSEERKTVK